MGRVGAEATSCLGVWWVAAVTLSLGVWGTGKGMLPGEWEVAKQALSGFVWCLRARLGDLGQVRVCTVSAVTGRHTRSSQVDKEQDQ